MATCPSIRSSNRARTSSESGFALAAAVAIALLYLALIELLLIDGTRALQEADRFRARVVASTLAENGAELSAEQMVTSGGRSVVTNNADGEMRGEYRRNGEQFEMSGTGTSAGVVTERSTVHLQGRIVGNRVTIDYAVHSQ